MSVKMGNKNKLPDVFNTELLIKLFDAIHRPKLAIACGLAFFCGLRVSEVCNLKIENIDFERKRVKIVDSKNSRRSLCGGYGKDRYVPIPDPMISPLKKWIEIINGGMWFLPSLSSPDKHIRPKTINEQFREALDISGLLIVDYTLEFTQRVCGKVMKKKVNRHKYHFHTLRHAYATYLCDKGVDIYTISNLLGHNQVTTTQIYARISGKNVKQAIHQAFNTSLGSRIVNVGRGQPVIVQQQAPLPVVQKPEPPQHKEVMQDKVLEIRKLELEIKKMELESGKKMVEAMH
jgi:integrase/recombinase XerD